MKPQFLPPGIHSLLAQGLDRRGQLFPDKEAARGVVT